jgi:PAS domain S-box-containing protein
MSENEAHRAALKELDRLRAREAEAVRDHQLGFTILDRLGSAHDVDLAFSRLLDLVAKTFACDAALICAATPEGKVTILAQHGIDLNPDVLIAPASFLATPHRLSTLDALLEVKKISGLACGMTAPITIANEPQMALICFKSKAEQYSELDLNRLGQVSRFAEQPLARLRLIERNVLLAAANAHLRKDMPEGGEAPAGAVEAPLMAVNRAIDRLTQGQALVVEILNDLLTAPTQSLDEVINAVLAKVAKHFGLDRMHVFEKHVTGKMRPTYSWRAKGIDALDGVLSEMPSDLTKLWHKDLCAGQQVSLPNIARLPKGYPGQDVLLKYGIQSILLSPMLDRGTLKGFVGHDGLRRPKNFLPGEVLLLRSIANAICAVLVRRQQDSFAKAAQDALELERNRLKATVSSLPEWIFEVSHNGRFLSHFMQSDENRHAWVANLVGKRFEECLPEDVAKLGHAMLDEMREKGVSDSRLFSYPLEDGRKRWIRARILPIETLSDGAAPTYLLKARDVTLEIQQAEEFAQLAMVVKRTTNGVIVTDAEQHILWVNQAWETQTGWAKDEVIGRRPADFLNPKNADPVPIANLATHLAQGKAARAELLNLRRDGSQYWVNVDIQPMTNEAGQLIGYCSIEQDVSAWREQQAALAKAAAEAKLAQQRLEAAVDSLQDGFVYFNGAGELVLCNQKFRDMSPGFEQVLVPGVTLEELLRHAFRHRLMDMDGTDEQIWVAARLKKYGDPYRQREFQLPDGRWLRTFEKQTPDGGWVGLRVDITVLKEAEAQALSDRATAMDAAHDAMAISAPDGKLLYANPAFYRLCGLSLDSDIVGQDWSTYVGAEASAVIERDAALALVNSSDSWRGDVTLHRLSGDPAEVELSLTRRADGALVWVARDLAERRQSELETDRLRDKLHLAQRREVIGQLAAGLAHDFNNLIAAISGSAMLILGEHGEGDIDRVHQHAHRIQKSTERAEAMVRRLMTLGARPTRQRKTDIASVLREASDLLRPGMGQLARLTLDLAPDTLTTSVEPTDILQIILNLCINARDAMVGADMNPADSRITVSLRAATPEDLALDGPFQIGSVDGHNRYACLSVSDTGPGMTAQEAEEIFTPYFSATSDKEGTLGLSILTGVIKSAQGALYLVSGPRTGTEFRILLPLDDNQAAPRHMPDPRPHLVEDPALLTHHLGLATLQGKSVLIVDDEEDVLDVIAAFLERAGAEVAPTTDAQAAFEILGESPDAFDLIVTDFDMGSLTGADLARTAHSLRSDLPVILVTALPDWHLRDQRRGEDPRFFAVLGKPVPLEALVATAVAALGSRYN